MADAAWIKFYTGDFLGGVGSVNLTADEIGVYTMVLMLSADRGQPIEDDRRWIARRSGCSTRRCGQIIDRLIELGKLESRNGLLGNRRMIEEINKRDGKSEQARKAARVRWQNDDPELPLEKPTLRKNEDKTKIKSIKNEDKIKLNSVKNGHKALIPANSDDADASRLARARDSELRVQKKKEDSHAIACVGSGAGEPAQPRPRPEHFAEIWNELAKRIGRPTIVGLTDSRKQTLKARLSRQSIDEFQTVIKKIEASDFLRGDTSRWQGVTFDWIIKQANFIKVLEGNYDR